MVKELLLQTMDGEQLAEFAKRCCIRNLFPAAKVDLRILSGDAEIYGDGNTFAIRIMSDEPVVIRAGQTLTNLISGEKFEPADGKVTFKGEKMKSYLFHIG